MTRRAQRPRKPQRGGQALGSRPPWRARLDAWAVSNAQVLVHSLGRMYRSPVTSLMTAAVIGIALALPMGLYVTLQNLQAVSGGWDGSSQISVFLKLGVKDADARALGKKLRAMPEFDSVRVLSRADAMGEFRDLSGFGEALNVLDENPFPAVLILRPDRKYSHPQSVQEIVEQLRAMPQTDLVQLDLQWVKRLYTMMEIAQRGVLVVAALLSLAVLLIVGNTIRLDIQNRRDEIIITKLIGATNAFIRRPFLYSGVWYGLFGGIIAWLLIALALGLVAGPVHRLAGLYGSQFTLSALDLATVTVLLGGSVLLGLGGSWLAVSRHLSAIEPT